MPIYKHLVIASAKASPKQLASMMWKSCNVVLANGGVVHSLENHGVQSLAYPFVDRRGMVPQRHLRGRFVFTEMIVFLCVKLEIFLSLSTLEI